MITIEVVDADEKILARGREEDEVSLFHEWEYQPGSAIRVRFDDVPEYYWMQLDDAGGRSLVYVIGDIRYEIPFGEKRTNLSPKVFSGQKHLLWVRKARDFEYGAYRNLAFNVWDQHHIHNLYPHAHANVETRGEAVFAASNAIDGVTANNSHGEWPYASWGINRQDDARIRLDFGRMVTIDRLVLYTRADFPHDNWWESVDFSFSDGSALAWKLEKSVRPHEIVFEKKEISWLEMHDMKKSPDPSPFPALTQIEVYGC